VSIVATLARLGKRVKSPSGKPAQQQQQIGVLFIITQHMQPSFIIVVMQSQQA
jgi:hypothetical protein